MNDKEIREYIKKQTASILPPKSLEPEKIEEKLAEVQQKKTTPFVRRRNLVAAACLLLVLITSATFAGTHFLRGQNVDEEIAVADKETISSEDQLSYEEAYESIRTCLESHRESTMSSDSAIGIAPEENIAYESENAGIAPKESTEDYTDTDVQVDGIIEGDLVKTDGSYLYSLHDTATGNAITIFRANEEKVKRVSNLYIESSRVHEMYLEKDRLIVISTPWETEYGNATEERTRASQTKLYIYDVSDPSSPKKLKTQTQNENYYTARVSGDYLYTFSQYTIYSEIDKKKPETYIPQINGCVIPEDRVRCIDKEPRQSYMVMTSLAIDGSEDFTDSLCTLGGAEVFYVSNNFIYSAQPDNGMLVDFTKIAKYRYQKGKFNYETNCKVRGNIRNSYYMHEQDGNLCFVYNKTTFGGESVNGLCVLDKNLKQLGEIGNLGVTEDIYASYFMDNTAYFVTYRQTDPVFAVDISNPADPELKSELKLPGFSDYLHSFGENQLIGLGIGEDKWGQCAKMSIFTIGKNKEIKEAAKKKLTDYARTLANHDRHSVLVDEERQLVGFTAQSEDSGDYDYLLYSYNAESGKFKQMLRQTDISTSTRGIRIGDYFYVVDGERGVTSYAFPTCGTPGTLETSLAFESI